MTVTRRGSHGTARDCRIDRLERQVCYRIARHLKGMQIILDKPIGVAGAGSIGCFVGGMLAAAGRRVALLARPRVIGEIEANGLRLTSFDGFERKIASSGLTLSEDPSIFRDAGAVLVTVKSADTAEMADIIAKHAPSEAVIVSLQNGVGNVAGAARPIAGTQGAGGDGAVQRDCAGMGRFHRATSGDILIEQDEAGTAARLSLPGLPMRATGNIAGVQWGKLMVNLNNALNALADMPLRRQLAQRGWRRLFADQMAEGLAAIRAEGITPVSPTPIPANWMPPSYCGCRMRSSRHARADHEDRSRGALVDVGRSAAPPPHRDRLSAGRHHRHRRPARAARCRCPVASWR